MNIHSRTIVGVARPIGARQLPIFLVPQALPLSIPIGLTFGNLRHFAREGAPVTSECR